MNDKGRLAKIFVTLVFFLGLLFSPRSFYGLQMFFIFSTGLSHGSFSLVNRNLASWAERLRQEASQQAWSLTKTSLHQLKKGYEMEIGLQVFLTSKLALSLCSGFLYFELNEESTSLLIARETGNYVYAHPTKASAFPVSLNLIYYFPLATNFRLSLRSGAGLLFARYIDRQASRKESDLKFVYPSYQNASASGSLFLAGLGLQFQPEATMALSLETSYRLAKINELEGENKARQYGPLEFYEEYLPNLDLWQARLLIVTTEPDPQLIRSRQKAVIDFSGFSFKIGVVVRF